MNAEMRLGKYNPLTGIGETLQERKGRKEIENPLDILIVGAGVSGLTTGLCLLDEGHNVTIWAKDLPPNTTSNVAGAVWYPYQANPPEKIVPWGRISYEMFNLLEANRKAGIITRQMTELKPHESENPWWVSAVKNFRHATEEELPPGYKDGFIFDSPVVDTHKYLNHLLDTFRNLGGRVVQRKVTDLSDAFTTHSMVVNCAGLGARELMGDTEIYAARGQVVRINPNGFTRVVGDDHDPNTLAYIIPRVNDIVLGGSYEPHNENTEVNPGQTEDILRGIRRIAPDFPKVEPADVQRIYAGLRPVRSTVRVERDAQVALGRALVHNYGHGGSGITLSWGCASEVIDLINQTRTRETN